MIPCSKNIWEPTSGPDAETYTQPFQRKRVESLDSVETQQRNREFEAPERPKHPRFKEWISFSVGEFDVSQTADFEAVIAKQTRAGILDFRPSTNSKWWRTWQLIENNL